MADEQALENKYIVFHLKDEEYIIPVSSIGSIEKILPITRVPGVAPFIKGVMNLRGIVIPVIDIKERFFNQETELTEQARIIIIQLEEMSVGFIVEAANDVVDISMEHVETTPEVVGADTVDYVKGVIQMQGHLYIVLDLEKILDKENLHHALPLEQ